MSEVNCIRPEDDTCAGCPKRIHTFTEEGCKLNPIVKKCTKYPTSCPKVQAKEKESTLYPDRERWFQAIEKSCWVCAVSPCNYELEAPRE